MANFSHRTTSFNVLTTVMYRTVSLSKPYTPKATWAQIIVTAVRCEPSISERRHFILGRYKVVIIPSVTSRHRPDMTWIVLKGTFNPNTKKTSNIQMMRYYPCFSHILQRIDVILDIGIRNVLFVEMCGKCKGNKTTI